MNKICTNKRAFFEYEILEKHMVGIVLHGSEVKSIRGNKLSIIEAYCFIDSNLEIFIKGMHITEYKEGGKYNNHIPTRNRKLLMKKKEILKLQENISQKGLTIVPLEVIISDTGFVKIEIGLVRGKNLHDKKQTIRLRDLDRDLKSKL
jgi:SsrA-binding protein